MFHQLEYSTGADFFNVETGSDFSFPLHTHSCFEIILVTSGIMEIIVGKQKKLLKKDEAVIIFPNQIHSLKTHTQSTHRLCIFSKKIVNFFSKEHTNMLPDNCFFTTDKLYSGLFKKLKNGDDLNTVKGTLYLICGEFDRQAQYTAKSNSESEDLLHRIFAFVDGNFSKECTLMELEKNMSYSYVYLSSYFKKACGISFNEYVNHYRIGEACYLLLTTNKSMLDVSLECGYNSIRSFNRNFKEIMGISPKQYTH